MNQNIVEKVYFSCLACWIEKYIYKQFFFFGEHVTLLFEPVIYVFILFL